MQELPKEFFGCGITFGKLDRSTNDGSGGGFTGNF